jgi:5'-3' exonuclease
VSGSKFRDELFPEYKAHRKKSPNFDPALTSGIKAQMNELVDIFPFFGIKQLKVEGLEGDDLIGILAKELPSTLVVSGDKDMFQLLRYGVEIYYPPKELFLNKENFAETYSEGLSPEAYLYYRTIIGDTSDGIPGLNRFGEKTARKLLLKYGPWIEWFEENEYAPGGHMIRAEIYDELNKVQKESITNQGLQTLCRNYQLMEIGEPAQEVKEVVLKAYYDQQPMFDDLKIKEFFKDAEFNSMIAKYGWWVHQFRLLNKGARI